MSIVEFTASWSGLHERALTEFLKAIKGGNRRPSTFARYGEWARSHAKRNNYAEYRRIGNPDQRGWHILDAGEAWLAQRFERLNGELKHA